MILAIDPGTTHSAFVLLADDGSIAQHGKPSNAELRDWLQAPTPSPMYQRGWCGVTAAIEMVASYGMPVGREVFETCVAIGRFVECIPDGQSELIYRQEVKLHHCKSAKANDATIRQALIDRFGGKEKAIGRKATPGPLYGIHADEWSALAIALLVYDRELEKAKAA